MFTEKTAMRFFVFIFLSALSMNLQAEKRNEKKEQMKPIVDDKLLAKADNQLIYTPSSTIINPTTHPNLDKKEFNLTKKELLEIMIEEKELCDLSKELNFRVKDYKYIELYREIATWIGTPYRYGAMSKHSVDCSGFTGLVYKNVYNKEIPRVSIHISKAYKTVKKENLRPGDLVFFATQGKKTINHVGIYLGNNKFAHASTSRGVTTDSLNNSYFSRAWKKAVRIEQ